MKSETETNVVLVGCLCSIGRGSPFLTDDHICISDPYFFYHIWPTPGAFAV